MAEPTLLTINEFLSDFSVGYSNDEYIGSRITAEKSVVKDSGTFPTYNRGNTLQRINDLQGLTTVANEMTIGTGTDTYQLTDRSQAAWLAQKTINNAPSQVDAEMEVVSALMDALLREAEIRDSQLFFNTATYAAANVETLTGTARWNAADGTIVEDIRKAIDTPYKKANKLVFGKDVYRIVSSLPAITALTKNIGQKADPFLTAQAFAAAFEVEEVLIGRGRYYDTDGTTILNMWGNGFLAAYVAPAAGKKTETLSVKFVQNKLKVVTDFDVKRGSDGSHYYKVDLNDDTKIISDDLGYYIETPVNL